MQFRFINPTPDRPPPIGPLYRDVWRHDYKTWVAAYLDADGNQVGAAAYGYRKRDAITNIRPLSRAYQDY